MSDHAVQENANGPVRRKAYRPVLRLLLTSQRYFGGGVAAGPFSDTSSLRRAR